MLEAIQSADAIVMMDWLDGGNAIKLAFPEGAPRPPVINISNDFNIHNGWNMDYGALPAVDVNIGTVPETTTRRLVESLEKTKGSVPAAAPRYPEIGKAGTSGEIGLMDLALAFAEVTKDESMCITGRPLGWPSNANVIEHPHDFLGHTGGGGLGAGPSIAVGAALALRESKSDRKTVAILGDGDYMMGLTAIWNAATLKLPMLFLIANNHSYYNDENHQIKVAEKRGRPVERAPIGQRMEDPVPDLAALARAQGLEGEGPITDLADLPAALENAFKRVHAGASFVLDVKVRPEYVTSSMTEMD